MKRLISIGLFSVLFSQGWAAEPTLPVINKQHVRTTTSCEKNSVFVKFRNDYQAPMYSVFFATESMHVESPLSASVAYELPLGDSPVLNITFLEDKKGIFFGETYLIKKQGELEESDIVQKCEVASICECSGSRCETVFLTNGFNCQLTVEDEGKARGTETNPFIVATHASTQG